MRVIDVIMSPEFKEQMEDCIDEIRQRRIGVTAGTFKRGPLERLQEKQEFNAESLAKLYLGVLDSSLDSSQYPSVVRSFIKLMGDEAYRRAVIIIESKIETIKQTNESE